jgi:hypothetical protein
MGCDIHGVIEYKTNGRADDPFYAFCELTCPQRDYDVFYAIAGVRQRDRVINMFKPRGLPKNASSTVVSATSLFVVRDDHPGLDYKYNHVGITKALKWIAEGSSKLFVAGDKNAIDQCGEHSFITHPNYHSHSYLYADELESALAALEEDKMLDGGSDYWSVLETMKSLQKTKGLNPDQVRLVFWFDS